MSATPMQPIAPDAHGAHSLHRRVGDLARLLHDAQLAVKKGKWVCRRMDEKINRLLTRIPNARGEQPAPKAKKGTA